LDGKLLLFLLAFAFNAPHLTGQIETAIEGHWRSPNGSVIISIGPCDQSLCGHVYWASDKAIADSRKGGTDPLVGTELISEIVPYGEGRWKARLFVPDINKTTRAELREIGPDQLRVKGCTAAGLVCKSQIWTRTDPK